MRASLWLIVLTTSLFVLAAPGSSSKPPQPDVEVLEASVVREQGLIQVDARVKNISKKPLKQLKVIFRFEADENTVVTTQRIGVDEAVLPPGDEGEIHGQLRDTPRAVQVRIGAVDTRGLDLTVKNSGPFFIE